MVEMFAVYALLLAAWGVWHARGDDEAAAEPVPAAVAPPEVEPLVERGRAARRLLNT